MSEPEIARRCSQCGASIRVRAFFCPQCGVQLPDEQSGVENTLQQVQSEPSSLTETLADLPRGVNEAGTSPVEFPQTAAVSGSSKKQKKRDRRNSEIAARADAEKAPTLAEKAPTLSEKATTLAEKAPTLVEKAPLRTETASTYAGESANQEKQPRAKATPVVLIEDNVLPRVERLRKVSSVVFEEVAYDPSLRFVLVAAFLFFIFVVIVILSKVVG
jgi:hypothetical protein